MESDITKRSIGVLLDDFVTTMIKCFVKQDQMMVEKDNDRAAEIAREIQRLNNRRNKLIRAIDARFGDLEISLTSKTYDGL